jgi:protein phosphatase
MNCSYGFKDECLRKWGDVDGLEIYNMFNDFFMYLPLYSIIDEQVFVVHGGLWRNRIYPLSTLQKVDFQRGLPYMPARGLDFIFFDALWSDPQEAKGFGPNPRGDSMVTFGPDTTKRFLEHNKFRLLVRSHQLPDDGRGYEWWHDKKCLTLFSASNYCGDCGNWGAVLVLHRGEPDQLIEHYAPYIQELVDLETDADRAHAQVREVHDAKRVETCILRAKCMEKQRALRKTASEHMLASVVSKVQELVVQKRAELYEYWSLVDKSPAGVFLIPAAVWREGCALILDPAVPWMKVQDAMGVVSNSGEVHYLKFLTRYRVAFQTSSELSVAGWEAAVWTRLMETLLRADLPIREALAAIDSTNDGLVSMMEFGRLIESCRAGISAMQARRLLRTLAAHGTDGKVQLWDLLERLQVTLPIAPKDANESMSWVVSALRPLAAAVLDDAATRLLPQDESIANWPASRLLAMWFEDADTSANGYLEHQEFLDALVCLRPRLEKNGCPCSDSELKDIASYCDVNGNDGRINYFELLNGLMWDDSLGPEMKEDLLDGLHAAVFFNATPIRHAMQQFDTDGCGLVTKQHFELALQAVYSALTAVEAGELLTKEQISTITASLSQEVDGRINYVNFLDSFRVVDTLMGESTRSMVSEAESGF